MSSPLIIRKVKDSEGHEHGSDGRFVSTGGGGGVVSEHKSTAAPATPSSLIPSRPENHSQELAHEWARTLTAGEAQAVETEIRENHGWKNSFSDIRDPWMEQVATAAQRQRYRLEEKAIRDARDAYVAVNPVAATVPVSGSDGSTYWAPPSDPSAPPAMQKLTEFYRGEFISEHNRNDRGVDTRYQRAHATLVELAKTLDGGGERPSYMDNSEWSELEEATRWLHDSSAREWDETHPNGGELYRGIRPNHAKMFAKDLRVGDVFSMPDFVSTSDDFEVAAEFTGDKRDRMGEQMTPGGIRLKYEGVVGSDLLSSYRGSLSTYTLPTHTEGGFGQMEREILLRNKRTWRVKELVVTHEGYGQSMVLEPVEMAKATALKTLHAGLYERMIFSRSKRSGSPPIQKVKDSEGHEHGSDGRFTSTGSSPRANVKSSKMEALRASGRVTDATEKKPCRECGEFNSVLDGEREAATGKYQLDGKSHYCGSHIVRAAEGREVTWNGSSWQRTSSAPEKQPDAPQEKTFPGEPKAGTKAHADFDRKMRKPCKSERVYGHSGEPKYGCGTHSSSTGNKQLQPGERCPRVAEYIIARGGEAPSSSPPILRKVEDSAGHKHGEDGRFVGADGGGYKHGEAATVPFMRNTISAPRTSGFGQDIEPHGRYMSERFQSEEDVKRLNNRFADYATGEHSFEKPLVLPFGGGYDEATNWKRVLSEHYGKKGKALSRAILADGYDGIITHDKHGTSEIVDLSPLRATKKVKDVEGHEHGADGKFVSGSGASKSEPRREPKNEHEKDILQYVKMMRDLQAANAAARKVPTDRAEFYRRLLDEGEFFDDAPRPQEHKKADDNLCFMNSYHHAERNGHDYVEGIANPGGLFPMHHAWNAKQGDGTVLDRTWRESAEREGLPRAYYGIRVPMDELRRTMFKHETYGNFLKDPVMGSPEMKGRTGRVKSELTAPSTVVAPSKFERSSFDGARSAFASGDFGKAARAISAAEKSSPGSDVADELGVSFRIVGKHVVCNEASVGSIERDGAKYTGVASDGKRFAQSSKRAAQLALVAHALDSGKAAYRTKLDAMWKEISPKVIALDDETPLSEEQMGAHLKLLAELCGVSAPTVEWDDFGRDDVFGDNRGDRIRLNSSAKKKPNTYETLTHEFSHHFHTRSAANGDDNQKESAHQENTHHGNGFWRRYADVQAKLLRHQGDKGYRT